ncbi:MAG: right-handed parallel beta-helix repeat-containing protein [Planctomycetota bacterium]|jgi:predicted outer membrane repeat protein
MKNLFFAIAYLFLTITCQAQVITVDDNGPADFNSIQLAIDSAIDGDTVIVAPGTYTGPGNRDIDFLGKPITVRSSDPNDPNIIAATIINCEGSWEQPYRGFYFHRGENVSSVLDGLTITNGRAKYGGGIRFYESSPTISNCIISGNIGGGGGCGSSYGGGIYCAPRSSPTINNCTIANNAAGFGGGIACFESNPMITNCIIKENSLHGWGWGAGMYNDYESNPTLNPMITNCIIKENSLHGWGWGAGMYNDYESNPTFTNCIFTGNSANYGGGGMSNHWDSNPIVTNCTFTGNSANGEWALGGGIYCWNSSPTITNCILWGDMPEEIEVYRGSPVVTYSDVQGGWPGEGNINTKPSFAFPHDYHLMPDSACIDAGTNSPINGLPENDIDGNPRWRYRCSRGYGCL